MCVIGCMKQLRHSNPTCCVCTYTQLIQSTYSQYSCASMPDPAPVSLRLLRQATNLSQSPQVLLSLPPHTPGRRRIFGILRPPPPPADRHDGYHQLRLLLLMGYCHGLGPPLPLRPVLHLHALVAYRRIRCRVSPSQALLSPPHHFPLRVASARGCGESCPAFLLGCQSHCWTLLATPVPPHPAGGAGGGGAAVHMECVSNRVGD